MRALFLPCLLLATLSFAAPPKVAAPGLRGIGMDVTFVEFLNEQMANGLRQSGLSVVTANEIKALIGLERQKQLLGCKETDMSCMEELTNALGVDAIAIGDVVQLDTTYQVSLKLVSAVDARVLAFETARVGNREGMADAAVKGGLRMGMMLRAAKLPTAELMVDAGAAVAPVEAPPACDSGAWCKADMAARWIKPSSSAYDLNAVYASAPDNVWAVGYGSTVLHYDGRAWKERHAPTQFGGILKAVWSPSPQLAIVAGQNGIAYKWKGQGWVSAVEPNYASFYAVHGTADARLIFAATDKGILKLEGSQWTPVWGEGEVYDVFLISAEDGWAVGKQKLLRYRSGRWAEVKGTPKLKLSAVAATGPNHIWFGGDGVIVRHDPSKKGEAAWKRFALGQTSIVSIWGAGGDDVWASGRYGALMHFDGEDWPAVPPPGAGLVASVTGVGKDDIWFIQELPNEQQGRGVYHFKRVP